MKIHYSENMKECPYCGNEEFFIKQAYKGTCCYYMRFDMCNEKCENGEMYQSADHTDLTKYAYCVECGKRLFPIDEYYAHLHKQNQLPETADL